MKPIRIVVPIVLLALTAAGTYVASRVFSLPRIGVVDNNRLMEQFGEAIQVRKQFSEEKKVWDEQAKRLEDSAKAAMDSLATSYDRASKARKQALKENLMKWNQELNRYANATRKLSEKREAELMRPVLEKANSFVKTWAANNGYDVIYGTGNGGVILSAKDEFNITGKILSDLNKLYEGRAGAGSLSALPDSAASMGTASVK